MIEENFGVRFIKISDNFSGQRIDNFLRSYLKLVPKSMIYRIIRTGLVRINKKRVKFQYKLQIGDLLKIPPIQGIKSPVIPVYNVSQIMALKNTIIYEDNGLLILNKPSGIAVHGGSNLTYNIIDTLKLWYPKTQFLKLVHRLDRDTSGILLIAKNRTVLTCLHEQLRSYAIQKEYLAIVYGTWNLHMTLISEPIVTKNFVSHRYNNVIPSLKNKKIASTGFQVKEYFSKIATFLTIKPITGRTHQIRVHSKYAGSPIIGDKIYGNYNINTQFKQLGFDRLFLHASKLHFIHPCTKEILHIHAPIDQIFKDCLFFLRQFTLNNYILLSNKYKMK